MVWRTVWDRTAAAVPHLVANVLARLQPLLRKRHFGNGVREDARLLEWASGYALAMARRTRARRSFDARFVDVQKAAETHEGVLVAYTMPRCPYSAETMAVLLPELSALLSIPVLKVSRPDIPNAYRPHYYPYIWAGRRITLGASTDDDDDRLVWHPLPDAGEFATAHRPPGGQAWVFEQRERTLECVVGFVLETLGPRCLHLPPPASSSSSTQRVAPEHAHPSEARNDGGRGPPSS